MMGLEGFALTSWIGKTLSGYTGKPDLCPSSAAPHWGKVRSGQGKGGQDPMCVLSQVGLPMYILYTFSPVCIVLNLTKFLK